MYRFYLSCGFYQGDNIGITSSTCRHCTLSNSVMCNDLYPIPILSLFLYHPYILYFLIQRIFHFLVSLLFLLHGCMYSHQVYNSNVGLVPRQSWMVIPIHIYPVIIQKCLPSLCIVRFVVNECMSAYWAIKVCMFHIHIY